MILKTSWLNVKAKGKKEYEDKTGLTAQHDYVESGDSIMFKYESLATNEEKGIKYQMCLYRKKV